MILMSSIPDVEFEFFAPAHLICREDLPGGGVECGYYFGTKYPSLVNYSDIKRLIDRLDVAFDSGIKIDRKLSTVKTMSCLGYDQHS